MSQLVRKSHNVSVLVYHLVCVAKYRRVVFDDAVEAVLREVCQGIALRYEVVFLEIGTDGDHVHFLLQSVPTYSPTKIVTLVKSLIAREVFARCPHVKKQLWGGEFWSDGYFIASVGQQESEEVVRRYVLQQGSSGYEQLYTQTPPIEDDQQHSQSYTPYKYSAARGGDSLLMSGCLDERTWTQLLYA